MTNDLDKAWKRFVTRVNTYRAVGVRIVAFERECEGGWIMAFDTHGIDATDLPKSVFDVPAVKPWCKFYGWDGVTDDDVLIFDETDDLDFIYDSYDYTGSFPVMQLNARYEFGCITDMNTHNYAGECNDFCEAIDFCKMLQRDWDGSEIRGWEICGNEWRGLSDNLSEPWYVRIVAND